ncbi:TPA: hypothetical protein DDW69_00310 [candidate division CPR2 bacterium]|uniref:DUF4145 domain-containing protein n=1 Tax=candidate division CPR2 bacterium GW2011_GWC1_41_48 TaxID=1618344 RepID=A0A0G0W9G6_UNCC2|nr:MAG: hypothetical protein UT47_C0005G0008 [candidate division CPR2 bacterium GW2011_GWC2_39_35]KKR28175.1 MAG: hypothetical protein UT60_C0026G0006 [candidate division CPR2 bacterium GW2011_GWD2_39_7]KKS08697.1 MAG: hypothetical protein UU65_C0005G0008 [candidate division CPR2 bacterium GW2011_GWC1_41_48]OGB72286.1 MAG: hypothetical protein A2Y26_03475 [candidate division CPR2 bacterium GWD2_39_7]HBG81266.1 hypothetical protein [candidate division CPR2 bacterium]
MPNLEILPVILLAILGGVVLLLISRTGGQKGFNAPGYVSPQSARLKWKEIEEQFRLGKTSNLSKALIDADKLFDQALKDARVPGQTMGDRLKNARHRFDQKLYSELWEAHKLRNYYAHDVNVVVNSSQVKESLDCFGEGLRKLGKL